MSRTGSATELTRGASPDVALSPSAASPTPLTQLPGLEFVLPKARDENFPVALRVLRPEVRQDLLAVYGFARLVDDIGDELDGGPHDRLAALDAAEAELDRAVSGAATHPVFARLSPAIARRRLDRQLFVNLIEANRLDQRVTRYDSYEQLLDYCRLSANPVGRLVLAIFGIDAPEAPPLSDLVCTGLQLVEHWQDVMEDAGNGRIYLPAEDLEHFGVAEAELKTSGPASPAFRRLLAFEVGRARALLTEGQALLRVIGSGVRGVRGAGGAGAAPGARIAIAGFCGGGLAQVAAIERARYDVLAAPVKASKRSVAATTGRLLLSGGR
jgi:squalene synthase HpnC